MDTIYLLGQVLLAPLGSSHRGDFLWFRGPIQSNNHGFIGVYLFPPDLHPTFA
ncbi:hypothetical protein ASPCADRAFT_207717 [Aspergillus carbonarius ITEM 5010]|uniref:Uncharacterized protein n=1 Tax=Aspergillus carbonarius (strain ITEM 5010) TaxID=602072 RepID=A0A1R3RL73_ASPC5|nr:hypothetical protein ASPCADRAFT_207717 [Aspergillus carbonarius ITEM 5010]